MIRQKGFTVIEVLIVIVLLGIGSWLFFSDKIKNDAIARDNARKTSINAMYYALEEAYYDKNGYYPNELNSKVLRSVDPELFSDPKGLKFNESDSSFHYEGKNCNAENHCKEYKLWADLEKEDKFEKKNRNNGEN